MDTSCFHTIVYVRKSLAKFRNTFARESVCLEKDIVSMAFIDCEAGNM